MAATGGQGGMILGGEMTDVINLIVAAATFMLGVAVWLMARKIERINYGQVVQDSYTLFNGRALEDDENLVIAGELMGGKWAGASVRELRTAFLAMQLLNSFQVVYLGRQKGMVGRKYEASMMDDIFRPALEIQEVYELSQNRGYHPEFKEYCQRLVNESVSAIVS